MKGILLTAALAAFLAAFGTGGNSQTIVPSAATTDDCSKSDEPVLKAIAKTRILPPYPKVSVFGNEEGDTVLTVVIDQGGNAVDAAVFQSSGSEYLDEAAVNFVKSTWKWEPPTIRCKPASVKTNVQVKWRLYNSKGGNQPRFPYLVKVLKEADYPPEILSKKLEGMVGVMVTYSEKGIPLGWWVVESSDNLELDKASAEIAMRRYQMMPMRMTGQPIKSAAFFAIVWTLSGEFPSKARIVK